MTRRGLVRSRCSPLAKLLAGLVVALGAALGAAGAVAAQINEVIDAGDITVVDADDPTKELAGGDADTAFTLRLPDGSSCPGDSANDDWRVQTFLVATAEGPPRMFGSIGPLNPDGDLHGDSRWALYGVDTVPFVQAMTSQNGAAGEPGLIVGIPAFDMALFTPERLPPGNYRIGIACTYFRETATYWDAEIVVASDPDAAPSGLRWRLSTAPASLPDNGAGDGSNLIWVIVGSGALAAIVAAVLIRGRSRRTHSLAKEHS